MFGPGRRIEKLFPSANAPRPPAATAGRAGRADYYGTRPLVSPMPPRGTDRGAGLFGPTGALFPRTFGTVRLLYCGRGRTGRTNGENRPGEITSRFAGDDRGTGRITIPFPNRSCYCGFEGVFFFFCSL